MSFVVSCPGCSRKVLVPKNHWQQTVHCPECSATVWLFDHNTGVFWRPSGSDEVLIPDAPESANDTAFTPSLPSLPCARSPDEFIAQRTEFGSESQASSASEHTTQPVVEPPPNLSGHGKDEASSRFSFTWLAIALVVALLPIVVILYNVMSPDTLALPSHEPTDGESDIETSKDHNDKPSEPNPVIESLQDSNNLPPQKESSIGSDEQPQQFKSDIPTTFKSRPWTPDVLWSYAECIANGKDYFRVRDYNKAVACFSRALELNRTKEALESRAAASYRNADYAQTVEDCTAVLELDPWRAAAYQLRSMANDELGKFGAAAFDAQRARELDPAVGKRRSAYD